MGLMNGADASIAPPSPSSGHPTVRKVVRDSEDRNDGEATG